MALASQRTPNSIRNTPTTSCTQPMSMPVASTRPAMSVMAASVASPASEAPIAPRQPMVRLTASTIVKASTHSTRAVRKDGTAIDQSIIALICLSCLETKNHRAKTVCSSRGLLGAARVRSRHGQQHQRNLHQQAGDNRDGERLLHPQARAEGERHEHEDRRKRNHG